MKDIQLRNYQQKQLKFLRDNEDQPILGVQSPTGTGKSIMILTYIKEWIDKHKDRTVVLSTGFNQLVFQMERVAKDMGINCQLLIGASYLLPNCEDQSIEDGLFKYGTISTGKCSNCKLIRYKKDENGKLICEDNRPSNCSRSLVNNYIANESHGGQLIITNHSYFLTMKQRLYCDLLIVDEAHTFSDFYQNFMTVRMSKDMKLIINNYTETVDSPTALILGQKLNEKKVSDKLINMAISEMKSAKMIDSERADKYKNELSMLYSCDDYSSYIDSDSSNDEPMKYVFYHYYKTNAKKTIILSATLDDYTKKMFGLRNRNQLYVQKEPLNRYKGSYFMPISDDFKQSMRFVFNQLSNLKENFDIGLILCNTIENVNWFCQNYKDFAPNYEVTRNLSDFINNPSKHKLLVGSKRYFQGVDIPELNFVFLDKLPFATYDNRFRAYEFYLQKETKCEPWTDYTLPLVKNSLLQACGRLWRLNDYQNNIYDHGLFIISDKRLESKFSYLKDYIMKMKPGIKLIEPEYNKNDNGNSINSA